MTRLVLVTWCCLMLCGVPRVVTSETIPEYLIKAAYLYNFALFVEWPAGAFADRDSPIVIGLVGTDPFDGALDRTVQGKHVNGRRLVVRRLEGLQSLGHCHILFVSASAASGLPDVIAQVGGAPVLVVGEALDFARNGGTINFFIDDDKVRFEVNIDAARRARLDISARLLNVARIVRGG